MRISFFVLIGSWALLGNAEDFFLKHVKTGKVYGPYASESGSRIQIGTEEFTLVKEGSEVEKKLQEIILKEVDFRNAPLEDAVQYLVESTRRMDPDGVGVNIVIAKGPAPQNPPANEGRASPFGFSNPGAQMKRGIDLQLREVSGLQVLNSLMDATGYSYKTTGNIITILPK